MNQGNSVNWAQHNSSIKKGQDVLGLFGVQPQGQKKSTANLNQFHVEPIDQRNDFDIVSESFKNIEKQSWKVSKNTRSQQRTEIKGEAVALNVMLKKKNYELAFAVNPGHGAGVDQVWCKRQGNPPSITEWLIVEAKGPNAKLSRDSKNILQMSPQWIKTRISSMTRSGDLVKQAVAKEIFKQLNKTNGIPVKGLTITAKEQNTGFGYSQSRYQKYN